MLGFVYLPSDIHLESVIEFQEVQNIAIHPKTNSYEVMLTPVVSIAHNRHGKDAINTDSKIIIELMKTAKVSEYGDKQMIPMYRGETKSYWEELNGDYEMLEDRIRLKIKYFEQMYFTTIVRFSPPTASVVVDPYFAFGTESQAELTVPELPGFKVQIPSNSVQQSTEVKATLYYDSEVSKDSNEVMATASVKLEPHGSQFTKNITVQIPIPGYSEIIDAHPDARLEFLYSPSDSSEEWVIQNDLKIDKSSKGEVLATFSTKRFSMFSIFWTSVSDIETIQGSIFHFVKSLSCRCQVFMSQEVSKESGINFSIQVLVNTFSDHPHEIPTNYHYVVHDSDKNPINLTAGDLHFTVTLKDCLFTANGSEKRKIYSKTHTISEKFPARAEFDIDLEKESKSEFLDGAVFAYLKIKEPDDSVKHDCNLIKVIQSSYNLTSSPGHSCHFNVACVQH